MFFSSNVQPLEAVLHAIHSFKWVEIIQICQFGGGLVWGEGPAKISENKKIVQILVLRNTKI